jgi:hypothetical protein
VASGEDTSTELLKKESEKLPYGWAVTYSGRLSGVSEPGALSETYPFSLKERVELDEALKWGSRSSKARFAVYIGDLGAPSAAAARALLAKVPTPDDAVLIAVSPNQRVIEIVYGSALQGRGAESAAPLGVAAATSAFQEGNLIDGLVSAVRVMSAGIARP